MQGAVKGAWHLLPLGVRSKLGRFVHTRIQPTVSRFRGYRPVLEAVPAGAPLVIAGMFRSASGLGEAARATAAAVSEVGFSPIVLDITERLAPCDFHYEGETSSVLPDASHGTLILHVNAPETYVILRQIGALDKKNWRVIGYWAWELPTLPKEWAPAFKLVSELWTLSDYSAQAIRSHPRSCKVNVVPIAVTPPTQLTRGREEFGLRSNAFVVLTMGDARSSFDRKNLVGAIRVFKTAFGRNENYQLIVKTRNMNDQPEFKSLLTDAIDHYSNITLLDKSITDTERWHLLDACDTVLSVHRAEGFGLPMAEAMALGKPVVATGYSGNMSFMDNQTAMLVPFELVPVNDRFGIYKSNYGNWAEPNLGIAAEHLRRLSEDHELRAQLGAAAKAQIEKLCSLCSVGGKMRELLG